MATTVKTIIQQLETKRIDAVGATKALFNQAIAYYFQLLQAHELLLNLPTKKLLTELEILTLKTIDNPLPAFPLPWQLPAYFRRAAINIAIGAAKSFYSNLQRWNKSKAKAQSRGHKFTNRPPVPPRAFNQHPLLYLGMYRFEAGKVLLKLYTGKAWSWIKFNYRSRAFPDGFKQASPKLVMRGKDIELHIPFEKVVKVDKALDQLKADPELKVCAVDLNINDNLAVCRILKADGTQIASRFIGGGASSSGQACFGKYRKETEQNQ